MDILDKVCEASGIQGDGKIPHPDCDGCRKKATENGACAYFRGCQEWREWFSYEWNIIREAAERMKHNDV